MDLFSADRSRLLPYAGGDGLAVDAEHLQLLSIFHYITGGLLMLMSCLFIAMFVIGEDQMDAGGGAGWKWIIVGGAGLLLGWVASALLMLAGYCISRRKSRLFVLVIAALEVLLFPFGTLLGVVTFWVMGRDSIKRIYG